VKSLVWRIAARDVRRGRARYLLAVLVIAVAAGAGACVDSLVRSVEPTSERYAHWSLGTQASARVEWYGSGPAQQTPRADLAVGAGEDAPLSVVAERLSGFLPSGSTRVALRKAPVAIRSGSSLTDGILAAEGPVTDPLLTGLVEPWRGVLPNAPGEVSLSRHLAERLKVTVGDVVQASADPTAPFIPVRVVGVHQNNPLAYEIVFADGTLLAAPVSALAGPRTVWWIGGAGVTWDDVLAGNQAGFVTLSRTVVLDPPPDAQVPIYQSGAGGTAEIDATVRAAAVLVGGTLIVLLISPVFAIGARRSRRDYAMLRAQGAPGKTIRQIMMRSSGLVGAGATIVGATAGLLAASVIVASTTAAGGLAFPDLVVSWPDMLGLVVCGTVVASASAWGPARRAARDDPVTALRGDSPEPAGSRRRRPAVMLALLAGAVLAAAVAAVTGANVWLVPGGVLGALAIVLAPRLLLPLLGRLATRLPVDARIAVRDATRRADRTSPAVTGVAAALAFALVVLIMVATAYTSRAAAWAPRAAPGTIMVFDGAYMAQAGQDPSGSSTRGTGASGAPVFTTAAERRRLHDVISEFVGPTTVVDVRMLSLAGDQFPRILIDPAAPCPAWADQTESYNRNTGRPAGTGYPASAASQNCWIDKHLSDDNSQPSWATDDGGDIVVDDGTLVRALGLPGAQEAANALAAGQVVLTRSLDRWPDGTAHLGVMHTDEQAMAEWGKLFDEAGGQPVYENPPDPIENATLVADAVVVDWPSAQWRAFIPPSLLTRAPLDRNAPTVETVGLIATGSGLMDQQRLDELRDRLSLLGVSAVDQARGYRSDDLTLLVTVGTLVAALVAFAVTWGTSRLAVTDMGPDLRVLGDVGAAPRSRRRIATVLTVTVGLLGTLAGTLAGLLLGVATVAPWASDAFGRDGSALSVPWSSVAIIALGVPVVTAAAVWVQERVGGTGQASEARR